MPSRSAIMAIDFFTFSCQRQKTLEVPSLPSGRLEIPSSGLTGAPHSTAVSPKQPPHLSKHRGQTAEVSSR